MASLSASCLRFQPSLLLSNKTNLLKSSVNSISVNWARNGLRSSRLRISCAAKPETVNKVCEVVKEQLALDDSVSLTPDTKFSELGADSLDTVEIVMSLEEKFNINVEEDSSQNIATVQDAADLIQNLIEKAPAS